MGSKIEQIFLGVGGIEMSGKGIVYYEIQLQYTDKMNAIKVEIIRKKAELYKKKAESKIAELIRKQLDYKKYCEYQIQMLKLKQLKEKSNIQPSSSQTVSDPSSDHPSSPV